MSRLHDMGGRLGDGPVRPDPKLGPVFEKPWHARVLALTLAAGALGQWPLDRMRHQRECLSPQDYMRFSYYEKWLSGLTDILVATGVVSVKELKAGRSLSPAPELEPRILKSEQVQKVLSSGGPSLREIDASSCFAAGEMVTVRRRAENELIPQGHSRLPAYIQGVEGRVLCYHGAHVLPDSNAHGLGEAPEPLYSVLFRHGDVWADSEHPHDELVLDMWQSYLEPA
ncbi:MAG: nitrile hydratase subunit beta [Paracoccaceae bacterium]|nr:nitrile hydratase subunit beta [Paracoccaceae bacterium]